MNMWEKHWYILEIMAETQSAKEHMVRRYIQVKVLGVLRKHNRNKELDIILKGRWEPLKDLRQREEWISTF
jgi:hypothetical protein